SAVVLLKLASNFSLPDNELIGWVLINIRNAFIINLILAAFNLIPFPPLDGSKILAGFLPNKLAIKMILFERYGMIILFALLFLPSFIYDFIGIDINILGWYVSFVKRILAYFMFKTVNF
ncbi:MAG: site-2 protease family protein, partial [Alphaproteobacteria bacterium]